MFDVFIMDMGGHDENVRKLTMQMPHAQTMRYMTSHLEMIKRAAAKSRTEFFWLIASCCDYSNFNFEFIPVPWEQDQIHCWASGNQKFGDTFLINYKYWKKQQTVEKLEWYQHVNYHVNGVNRLPWPKKVINDDYVDYIKNHTFKSLYEQFSKFDDVDVRFDPNLWDDKNLISYTKGESILCPRNIKGKLSKQLYDYNPITFIKGDSHREYDIVFISYDETQANKNWLHLKEKFPKAIRLNGIKGNFAALKKAASLVKTPYFYAVFAKTELDPNFKFDYAPDYLKEKTNYVFYAYNPVLKCHYGHGAIKMYHTNWLRETEEFDIDLTMSLPISIVPINSCTNNYNETPWSAWRTAFREAYKLHNNTKKTIDDEYHLHLWLTSSDGLNGEWSMLGANQAINSKISSEQLNDWNWLEEQFNLCYQNNLKFLQ